MVAQSVIETGQYACLKIVWLGVSCNTTGQKWEGLKEIERDRSTEDPCSVDPCRCTTITARGSAYRVYIVVGESR
jgi:hypothetical protein